MFADPQSSDNEFSLLPLSRHVMRLQIFEVIINRPSVLWIVVVFVLTCGLWQVLHKSRKSWDKSSTILSGKARKLGNESQEPDPGLLKKNSKTVAYSTTVASYPEIRRFYHPHPRADKLPTKPRPLPLLIFVHGLGGSLAQFTHILTSLVNVAACFGIDLPGCGLSRFYPRAWEAYSHAALVELLGAAIEDACELAQVQEVVLICHSMGCSLAASLVSESSKLATKTRSKIIGLIAICPKASMVSVEQANQIRWLLRIPTPLFDLLRKWDRRGGVNSASVTRMTGQAASLDTKQLQLKFNEQSKSGVWRRMVWGGMANTSTRGESIGGLPGPQIWAGISVPIFAVAGEADGITDPEEIRVISTALGIGNRIETAPAQDTSQEIHGTLAGDNSVSSEESVTSHRRPHRHRVNPWNSRDTAVESDESSKIGSKTAKTSEENNSPAFRSIILPSPASHALLYDYATYRTLSGLVQSFLADHIDSRLSLGWQLQHLKKANKWDVKNLAKWQAVQPVSEPIGGVFRAMKTLREVDEIHSPTKFLATWREKIKAVIDISHESPVYDPRTLDEGGIQYHKFPTVSKIPPTLLEVKHFIDLVDRLLAEGNKTDRRLISVHCHYGKNRSGFFICSWLIERRAYTAQEAIDEFKVRRPPGIRHAHFMDTLFARYYIGSKRATSL